MKEMENLQENLKKLPKYGLSEDQKEKINHRLIKKKNSKKSIIRMKPLIAFGLIGVIVFVLILSSENSSILNEVKLSFQPQIELNAPQAAAFKNQNYDVIGIEGKLGILVDEKFVAEDHRRGAKLMLYFWGDPSKLLNKDYRVEAVNGNNDKLILSEGILQSPLGNEDAHTLTSFPPIPTAGEWQLSFFVDNQLFSEFTMEVLPPFPRTENFLLRTSPLEMELGEEVDVYIDSMLVEKKEIKVNLVNNKGKVVSEHLFIQSSEAIDSSTGKPLYTYSGTIKIPDYGKWKLEIDGEQTKLFEN